MTVSAADVLDPEVRLAGVLVAGDAQPILPLICNFGARSPCIWQLIAPRLHVTLVRTPAAVRPCGSLSWCYHCDAAGNNGGAEELADIWSRLYARSVGKWEAGQRSKELIAAWHREDVILYPHC